ncbi:Plasmid stabilization system protein [Sporomusa ovata DSM 2662]|uniref:Death on curing protein, Doc toxin n=1 Tax=Sporomusa ovata TaxID=2378 RepID=A0A0U1L6R2_9FIRM|nr:type II toxin-antitoxin system RelE/ParE family toxin [Sporomusa ovata]EQB24622.1 plasmid stabilization system protein [Sporomusa ovata DSM 2662]CQR74969.1 hypothetical protein SpAn4DRAFT_4333 [Sporomusa ovata]
MYKLIISELAHQDLDNIVSYMVVQLANSQAATDFLNDVFTCYDFLKNNPMMYEKCQDKRLGRAGYRKAVIRHYIMVYNVNETSQTVFIMRFFHGAQNYGKLV